METNKLYYLSPNEDITIINLRTKLLILENNYINQEDYELICIYLSWF